MVLLADQLADYVLSYAVGFQSNVWEKLYDDAVDVITELLLARGISRIGFVLRFFFNVWRQSLKHLQLMNS